MEKAVMNKVVEMICNQMCLDHAFYQMFRTDPKAALANIYANEETKDQIVALVNQRLQKKKLGEWWENRVKCCCNNVAYDIPPDHC